MFVLPSFRLTYILNAVTYYLFYCLLDPKAVCEWAVGLLPNNPTLPVGAAFLIAFQGSHIIPVVVFYALYHYDPEWARKYEIEPQAGFHDPNPEKRKAYYELVEKTARFWVRKRIEETVFFSIVIFASQWWFPVDGPVFIETAPTRLQVLIHNAIGFFIFDTCFYWGHRLGHDKLYKYHKLHHEYFQPVTITGVWGHDVDGVLTMLVPALSALFLTGMHFYSFILFTIANVYHTYLDHCGYDFPYNPFQLIPFSGYIKEHNYHHSHNIGNFGLYFTFWDWIMGTNKAYQAHKAKMAALKSAGVKTVKAANGNGKAKAM